MTLQLYHCEQSV